MASKIFLISCDHSSAAKISLKSVLYKVMKRRNVELGIENLSNGIFSRSRTEAEQLNYI